MNVRNPEHVGVFQYSKDDDLYGFAGDVQKAIKGYFRYFIKTIPSVRGLAEINYNMDVKVTLEFSGADVIPTGDRNRPRLVTGYETLQAKWKLDFSKLGSVKQLPSTLNQDSSSSGSRSSPSRKSSKNDRP